MVGAKIANDKRYSKLRKILGTRKWLNLGINLFFTGAIIFFFFRIYFGLDFTDSFYHLNQAIQPVDGIHLYPFLFSSLILKEIIEFFGKEIIHLRYVNSFLLFFSFLIPFLFLKVIKSKKEVLFYIACGLILYSPFSWNIMGYDTFSIFIISLIFSVSVLYLKKPQTPLLIILAFLCALAILIRLPNLLSIPILVLILTLRETKYFNGSGNFMPILLFISVVVLGVFAGYFFYYSSWEEFITATGNTGSHHISELLSNYLIHALQLFLYILFIISTFLIFRNFYKKSNLISILFILIIYMMFLGYFRVFGPKLFNYGIFLLALAISMIGLHLYFNRKILNGYKPLVLLLFLLFLFINPFGSDTGLLKGYSMFLLLPFVLATIDLKLKRFWFTLILATIPFAVYTTILTPYQDMNLLAHNSTLNHELLYPIKTKEIRAVYLEEIGNLVKELEKENYKVYFYGNKRHIFEYLYPNSSFKIRAFSQPIDLNYLPQIIEGTANAPKVAIFLMSNYPEFPVYDFGLLEKELLRMNFEKTERYNQIFFLKN